MLWREATKLFARREYDRALALWHRIVRLQSSSRAWYNLALCYDESGSPVQGYRAYARARAHSGRLRLPVALLEHLKARMAALEPAVARVRLACRPGLVVVIGPRRLRCPASPAVSAGADGVVSAGAGSVMEDVLQPGRYTVVASAPGRLPWNGDASLVGGEVHSLTVPVLQIRLKRVRRWSSTGPWAAFGMGAGLVLAGAALLVQSWLDFRTHDRRLDSLCSGGCQAEDLPSSLSVLRSKAGLERDSGWGTLGVGAAVAVAGAVLLVLNRPRWVPTGVESQERGARRPDAMQDRASAQHKRELASWHVSSGPGSMGIGIQVRF